MFTRFFEVGEKIYSVCITCVLEVEFRPLRWYNRRVLLACVGKTRMRTMVVREAFRQRFVNYAHLPVQGCPATIDVGRK